MKDADHFIFARSSVNMQDFEFLYLKTTIFTLPFDIYQKIVANRIDPAMQAYIDRVNSTLTYLQTPNENKRPLFVYAHIVSPHNPKVYTRTGGIEPDWEIDIEKAAENTYGYIEDHILMVINAILDHSDPLPIIVLQADHGDTLEPQYRTLILNAYYLPEGGEADLYPTISPINTFRVIFNRYFNQSYPLLEDKSYFSPEKSRYDFQLGEDPYGDCRDLGVK